MTAAGRRHGALGGVQGGLHGGDRRRRGDDGDAQGVGRSGHLENIMTGFGKTEVKVEGVGRSGHLENIMTGIGKTKGRGGGCGGWRVVKR